MDNRRGHHRRRPFNNAEHHHYRQRYGRGQASQNGEVNNANRNHRSNRQRPQQHQQYLETAENTTVNSSQPRELPGFVYDEATRKYYRIAPDHHGMNGFSQSDVARQRRERERAAQISSNRPRVASGSFSQRPITMPITSITDRMSLGGPGRPCSSGFGRGRSERFLSESRLLGVKNIPNSIQEVNPDHGVKGCQFLSVSNDGTGLVGCWSGTSHNGYNDREMAFVQYMKATIDDDLRNKMLMEQERSPDSDKPLNTMGLVLTEDDECLNIIDPSLVDMCVAPVDSDVTCCLYVTASTMFSKGVIQPRCNIVMQPIPEWSRPEPEASFIDSPIYNIYWTAQQGIWSCAWTGKKMRVALGLEDSAKILDVVSEQKFVISSKKKNVLCQQFSPDGNLLFMGLLRHNAIRSDLRMSSKHVTGEFGSNNVSNIHVLTSSHPDCIITENFGGELKLWDARRADKSLLDFKGHRNEHYRMSYQVDSDEYFIFAVGDDGYTRGWSLASGDLLCSVPSPRPTGQRADFPRIAYSSRWGGRHGNAALVLAVGDSCRIHQLDW